MTNIAQAINSLDVKNERSGSASVSDPVTNASEFEAKVTWFDVNGANIDSPYSWDEVEAEFNVLAALETANLYQQKRRDAYPYVGDQLDDLFRAGVFSDEMTAILQAVKNANPKPE